MYMYNVYVHTCIYVFHLTQQGYTSLHFKETLESLTIVKYLAHNGAPVDTPSYVCTVQTNTDAMYMYVE